ncbi:MAG: hypothetical protein OSA43_03470 [Pirellulales bacterium]|jgi:hypothetical protein|nr:hypothetical protein [Pirellulales bacterium]
MASPAEKTSATEAFPREDFVVDAFLLLELASDFDLAAFLAEFFFDMRSSEDEADTVCGVLLVDVIIVIVSLLS